MPLEVEAPPGEDRPPGTLVIGLINNMPDAALRATEGQFAALLGAAAAGSFAVRLRRSYLPEILRGPQAQAHIATGYWPLEALLTGAPDALVVTGTEPRSPDLEGEPYWPPLVRLLEWTQAEAMPSIWSCLAAHAVVQALDGIRRHRLPEKRFGVFAHTAPTDHFLFNAVQPPVLTPHSRWNELSTADLSTAGYILGSVSAENGADCFIRPEPALRVCFQGHPEYEETTLLLEYRRDVGRFLRGEQAAWPSLPTGYFSAEALGVIDAFRDRTERRRDPADFVRFPTERLAAGVTARWRVGAVRIMRNWLEHVAAVAAIRAGVHRSTPMHSRMIPS